MKTLRLALSVVSILLLGMGSVASLAAYLGGWAPDYYARIDQPPVASLALVLVVAAVICALVPDREDPAP
jgi:hypothetical protein